MTLEARLVESDATMANISCNVHQWLVLLWLLAIFVSGVSMFLAAESLEKEKKWLIFFLPFAMFTPFIKGKRGHIAQVSAIVFLLFSVALLMFIVPDCVH